MENNKDLKREEIVNYMFLTLENNLGQTISCIYNKNEKYKGLSGKLTEINGFSSIKIEDKEIKFFALNESILAIKNEDKLVFYNDTIDNNFNISTLQNVEIERIKFFGSNIINNGDKMLERFYLNRNYKVKEELLNKYKYILMGIEEVKEEKKEEWLMWANTNNDLDLLKTSAISMRRLSNGFSPVVIEKSYMEVLNENQIRDIEYIISNYYSLRGEEFKKYLSSKELIKKRSIK